MSAPQLAARDPLAQRFTLAIDLDEFAQRVAEQPLSCSLGLGAVTSAVKNAVIGSVGEYNWGGAAGTVFWIDPVEELVVVSMIQLMNFPLSTAR